MPKSNTKPTGQDNNPEDKTKNLSIPVRHLISDGEDVKSDTGSEDMPAEDESKLVASHPNKTVKPLKPLKSEDQEVKSKDEQTNPPSTAKSSTSDSEAKDSSPDSVEDNLADKDEKAESPAIDKEESPETVKALEEANKQSERDKEIEATIDSKQYYVPINEEAEKKSIKVSILLTLIVILLAIVLVDLMLDTGSILLLQKIPHTHYFSSPSN